MKYSVSDSSEWRLFSKRIFKIDIQTIVIMDFNLQQYKETAFNLDEASGQDTFELLLVFSGVMTFIVITPALFVTTGELIAPVIGVILGLGDLAMSQYLPERMEFQDEKEDEKEDQKVDESNEQKETEYNV